MTPLLAGKDASAEAARADEYARHRPEQTRLYQLVEQYYPAFVEHLAARERTLQTPGIGPLAPAGLNGRYRVLEHTRSHEGSAKFWTQQPPSTASNPARSFPIRHTPCSISSTRVVILPKVRTRANCEIRCARKLRLFRKFRQQRFKCLQQIGSTRSRDLKYLPLVERGIAVRQHVSKTHDQITVGDTRE